MFRIRLLEGEWYNHPCLDLESLRKYFEEKGAEFFDNYQEVLLPRVTAIRIGSDFINNDVLFNPNTGVYSVQCDIIIDSTGETVLRTGSRDSTMVFREGKLISDIASYEPVQLHEGDILQIRRNKIKLLEARI